MVKHDAIVLLLVLALAGALSACGANEITPVGQSTYLVSSSRLIIAGGSAAAEKDAIAKGTQFCAAQGQRFRLIQDNRTGIRSTDIVFSCGSSVGQQIMAGQSPPEKPISKQGSPTIFVPLSMQTSDDTIEVIGRVGGGGNGISMKVDGHDAPIQSDGTFSFHRVVPLGTSEIKLSAMNEWGQSADSLIKVTRTLAATADTSFAPLDPTRMRGKSRPKAIALIIGVENYHNAPPAEFAENDARLFYDYAANALGVPKDRIKFLAGAEARRLDVQKAVRTWLKPLVVKGQTDVFVFFSGHGLASDDGTDLYLLPYDGERDLLADSAIRRKDLIDNIVDAGPASATFFLDTCYSGGTRGKDTLIASARPILVAAKQQDVPPNVTILAAAGNDQLSSSLESVKHGLFSYFLMKGLEGEAAEGDHSITAAKLDDYLASHVPSEAAKLGRAQMPQLIGDGGRVVSSW